MKAFYDVSYHFYCKTAKKPLRIIAISDIHFSPKTTKHLDILADKILAFAIDPEHTIITISGDLVDHLDNINDESELERLRAWLTRLGKIAPVYICLGNHDFYRIAPDDPQHAPTLRYVAEIPSSLTTKLADIDNVHLLDTDVYEDKNFIIAGVTLPPAYYDFSNQKAVKEDFNNPTQEDPDILLEAVDTINQKMPKKTSKIKIALIHSPVHLTNHSVETALAGFDYVIAGHMHNGVVPPLMNEIWHGKRGIVTPGKNLFADVNSRVGLYGKRQNIIVCGAVTTIQTGAKALSILNNLYPINVATIDLVNNETLARKPDIHRKYEKW